MRRCSYLIFKGLVYRVHERPMQTHTLLNTELEEAALPFGPALNTQAAVWSVGVGCQPLCVCKSLGSGSWMGAAVCLCAYCSL